MRLDARNGDTNYYVYDAEKCCEVTHVLWIDDETAEYWQYDKPLFLIADMPVGRVVKARRITIHAEKKLVIINPVEDSEFETTSTDCIATLEMAL